MSSSLLVYEREKTQQKFQVRVIRKEKVVPIHHILKHRLPLSNLDLLLPPEDVGVFFCYKCPFYNSQFSSFGQMVSTLEMALAQALVHFYAFSSEVAYNSMGEAELICNNEGVELIEAYADVELCELNFYNPVETVEGKLLPKNNTQYNVFSVQVTKLKCGGLVVGCTFDHRVADSYSANMFLVSWAEIASSKPISMEPCFTRSLLNARCPCSYDPSLDEMYAPILIPTNDKHEHEHEHEHEPLVSRIYHVYAKQIDYLQSQAEGTKLESLSAFMWKLIANHALEDDPKSKMCKIGVVVDGRTRLERIHYDCNKQKRLIGNYFGNVLSIPFGERSICDLSINPLKWVAEQVHSIVEKAVSNEHFPDLIDWVESHRPRPCVAKIYSSGREDGPAFVMSSGQQFPVSKLDFGWGKPVFGSYHFPWDANAGYVMPMLSSTGNGDWIVYMHLTQPQLNFIEKEARHVFNNFKL